MVVLYRVAPEKVYNYFGGGYHNLPKRNRPQKKIIPPQKKKYPTNLSRGVSASIYQELTWYNLAQLVLLNEQTPQVGHSPVHLNTSFTPSLISFYFINYILYTGILRFCQCTIIDVHLIKINIMISTPAVNTRLLTAPGLVLGQLIVFLSLRIQSQAPKYQRRRHLSQSK